MTGKDAGQMRSRDASGDTQNPPESVRDAEAGGSNPPFPTKNPWSAGLSEPSPRRAQAIWVRNGSEPGPKIPPWGVRRPHIWA